MRGTHFGPHSAPQIPWDEHRVNAILDRLDAGPAVRDPAGAKSYRYRKHSLMVRMQQPGSACPVARAVVTRHISDQILTLIHYGFVHSGTRCEAQLVTLHGSWSEVTGVVMQCQFLEGNLHEVEIQFDHGIDPAVFCAEASPCRILAAEDDQLVAQLLAFELRQLNAVVDLVENGERAVEQALAHTYDLLILDMEMPILNGNEVAAILRSQGYSGQIAAFTSDRRMLEGGHCGDMGFDRSLVKPFTHDDLIRLIESIREEPLHSMFHNDDIMIELVNQFVAAMPDKIRKIEQSVANDDVVALLKIINSLKEAGSSYGFEPITDSAKSLELAVCQDAGLAAAAPQVGHLLRLCRLVRGRELLTPEPRKTEKISSRRG